MKGPKIYMSDKEKKMENDVLVDVQTKSVQRNYKVINIHPAVLLDR